MKPRFRWNLYNWGNCYFWWHLFDSILYADVDGGGSIDLPVHLAVILNCIYVFETLEFELF